MKTLFTLSKSYLLLSLAFATLVSCNYQPEDTAVSAVAVTVSSPASGSYINNANKSSFAVSGACSESGNSVLIAGDASASVVCSGGYWSKSLDFSAATDGVVTISVTHATTSGQTASTTATYNLDTVVPVITMTAPVDAANIGMSLTVTGACETGLTVTITSTTGDLSPAVTTACTVGAYSQAITLTVGDNVAATIKASQTDAAGNFASASAINLVKDGTAPVVDVTSHSDSDEVQAAITITGDCDGADGNVAIAGDFGTTPLSVVCGGTFTSGAITLDAVDGAKSLTFTQTDTDGNVGTDTVNLVLDSVAPTVVIDSHVDTDEVTPTFTIEGACELSAGTVSLTGVNLTGSPVSTACSVAGRFSQSIAITADDTITATQTDNATNAGNDTVDVVYDNVVPAVFITAPATLAAVPSAQAVSGTCTFGDSDVTISSTALAVSQIAACIGGGTFSKALTFLIAGDGVITVTASQTDAAGNASSDSEVFTKDTTVPAVAITSHIASQPAKTAITVTGTCEINGVDAVTIAGDVAGADLTPDCAGNTFSTTGVTLTGAEATLNSISASQTDAVGNVGTSTVLVMMDNTAPILTITSHVAAQEVQATFTYEGTCEYGEGNVTLTAGNLVGSPVTASCIITNSFSQSITITADDTILASQTDNAGNVGSIGVALVFDNTVPAVAITSPASGAAIMQTTTIAGICTTGDSVVTISGADITPSVDVACAAGIFSQSITFSAGDAATTVTISQTDNATNTSTDVRTFVKDTTSPTVTIGSHVDSDAITSSITLTGTCDPAVTVQIVGPVTGSPVTTACTSSTFSQAITITGGDGSKGVSAIQTDSAGNVGFATVTLVLDGTAPALTFTSPAAAAAVGLSSVLQGTCESGLTITITSSELATAVNTACTAGVFSQAVTYIAGDLNPTTVIISQTDAVGNIGSASRDFDKDATAPVIAFTSPAAGSEVLAAVTIQGSCEGTTDVVISGAVTATTNIACAAGIFSQAMTLSGSDGSKTINISQTDSVGNVGTNSLLLILDTTAPALSITSHAENDVIQLGFTVGGTCETASGTVTLTGTYTTSPQALACSAGTFTYTGTLNADGANNLTVSQTDTAGNTGVYTRNLTGDSTAPVLAITAPVAASTITAVNTVVGTCTTADGSVTLSSSHLTSTTTACTAGAFTQAVTFSGADGAMTLDASQTDSAGNIGSAVQMNYTLDTTAPVVTIASHSSGQYVQGTVTIIGACVTADAVTVTITGDFTTSPITPACTADAYTSGLLTLSASDGLKSITVSQDDAVSNTGSVAINLNKDTVGPTVLITSHPATADVQASITLSGNCETAEGNVTISETGAGSITGDPITTACTGDAFTQAVTLDGAEAAVHTIQIAQTDSASNIGTYSVDLTLDTTAPGLSNTSHADNDTVAMTLILIGACDAGGNSVTIMGTDLQNSPVTTACTGTYTQAIALSGISGFKTLIIRQSDPASNVTQIARVVTQDNSLASIDTDSSRVVYMVDIDGDTNQDLIVGNYGTSNYVHMGNGDGSFDAGVALNGSVATNTTSVAVMDIDVDGDYDIVTGNYGGVNMVYLGDGTGAFALGVQVSADTNNTNAVVLGNFDADLNPDLVFANNGTTNRVHKGNGDGTFVAAVDLEAAVTDNSRALAIGDFDEDGDADIVVANDGAINRIYIGDGSGFFAAGTGISADLNTSWGISVGDIDEDGHIDVAIANYGEVNRKCLGAGDGVTFTCSDVSVDTNNSAGVQVIDVDGDSNLDIVFANFGQVNRVYKGDGSGAVTGSDIDTTTYDSYSIFAANLDGDALLDVVTGNDAVENRIYFDL